MINKQDAIRIENLHKAGIAGIIDILKKHETFKKWPFISSIIISVIVVVIIALIKSHQLYTVIQISTDLVLSVFPSLLGFSLGGYAISVGFSNTAFLKKDSSTTEHSLYQILSAIFAFSVILQILATLFGILLSWCIKTEIQKMFVDFPYWLMIACNILALICLFFLSIYSLLLTPYIVTNLFTLSQLNNAQLTIEEHGPINSQDYSGNTK